MSSPSTEVNNRRKFNSLDLECSGAQLPGTTHYRLDMIESLDNSAGPGCGVQDSAEGHHHRRLPEGCLDGAPNGLSAAKMTPAQYEKLMTKG